MLVIHPTYFASIIQYVAIVNAKKVVFEIEDNYQKQTYRNRCYIYGSNGKQTLTVPIIHSKSLSNYKTKDIEIDYSLDWQKLHIRSLQSAYRSSPYFEFYQEEILVVFQKKHKYLLDLNRQIFQLISNSLELNISSTNTTEYQLDKVNKYNFRHLVNAKDKQKYKLKRYIQVFNDKHGYISNLSILDLLFNEGPNTVLYLENHKDLLF